MVIKTGISGQLMVKSEVTYGTAVTPDRAYELLTEGIKDDHGRIDVFQVGRGRWLRHDAVKPTPKGAAGPVEMVVTNKNFGLLFEHAIGQNTVAGAGANKTHTIIPDANGLQGKSLTVQVGRPDVNGTVQPYTYSGGKVTGWELKCAVDQPLTFTPEFDFMRPAVTATALATPSYVTATEPYVYTEGVLTVGGVTAFVKEVSLKCNQGLNVDRRALGGTKREPLAEGVTDYLTGQLTCEFEDLTAYTAWAAGTQAALVLTFTLATLIPTTAIPYSLVITIPAIDYTGETPNISGPTILMQNRPFRALYNGSNPIITLVMTNADTAS